MTTRKPTETEHTDIPAPLAAKAPVGRFYELQQEVIPPTPYQLTEDIVIMPLTRRRNVGLIESTTHEDADRAFFGDAYDAIVKLYDDRPLAEWEALITDLRKHWAGETIEAVPGK
ncbi:hypothetical protein ACFWPK_22410 [Nocardia sp. NPDC058519]|uniref:hypothetical protein n=1 Tax=Nocardia sp. NPDC058519 TaxID=3346535 RepID=UPI0036554620